VNQPAWAELRFVSLLSNRILGTLLQSCKCRDATFIGKPTFSATAPFLEFGWKRIGKTGANRFLVCGSAVNDRENPQRTAAGRLIGRVPVK
jgi:hypothetical protein